MGLSPWSVNHDTACDGHQGGIVTWCTQGDTFTRLTESGSLLWIHGNIPISFNHWVIIAANRLSNKFLVLLLALGKAFVGPLLLVSCLPIKLIYFTSSVIIRDVSNSGSACVAYFDFEDHTGDQDLRPLSSSFLVQLFNQSNRYINVLFWLYWHISSRDLQVPAEEMVQIQQDFEEGL